MNVSRLKRSLRGLGTIAVPALPIVWMTLLFVVPIGFTIVFAFAHASFGGVELGFTLQNFKEALSGLYLSIFWRTIEFAVMGSALCLLVAVPVAYATARKSGRFKTLLLVLLLIPFWTSFLIRALSWHTLLEQGGPIEHVLNTLHLHSGPLNWLDHPTAVFIGIVYSYLPFAVIPLYVAFERIPGAVIEASKDLGAGQWRTFRRVTLPMARPGVMAAVLLTSVPMTGEFVIPALLGGNKGVLYGGLIDSEYIQSANYPLGSAMAVLLLVVLGLFLVAFTRLTRATEPVSG